jgi:hypothetical protein
VIPQPVKEFVSDFQDFARWPEQRQVDYLAFYLQTSNGTRGFTARDLESLFEELSLKPYSRLRPYLSEQASKTRNGKYVKAKVGYRLRMALSEEIQTILDREPKTIKTSQQLEALLARVTDPEEQTFLKEVIDCYRIKAFRAAIVMAWILAIHHLQKYVFAKKLNDFNHVLAKNPDRKIKVVSAYDQFSEMSESKLIEILRAAGIISNDVRKILDEKLGIRNSAAHPSTIIFDGHKTTEFISDLVNNVILKY